MGGCGAARTAACDMPAPFPIPPQAQGGGASAAHAHVAMKYFTTLHILLLRSRHAPILRLELVHILALAPFQQHRDLREGLCEGGRGGRGGEGKASSADSARREQQPRGKTCFPTGGVVNWKDLGLRPYQPPRQMPLSPPPTLLPNPPPRRTLTFSSTSLRCIVGCLVSSCSCWKV